MSTVKQKTNPYIMKQKVEKSLRLLKEVEKSIQDRDTSHKLWKEALAEVNEAIRFNLGLIAVLDDIAAFNKQVEAQKI